MTLFAIREKAEKNFDHAQLIRFDVDIAHYFTVENVRQVVGTVK